MDAFSDRDNTVEASIKELTEKAREIIDRQMGNVREEATKKGK